MARGINKMTLVGFLGQDPEVKYTQGGNAVTTISVATSDTWTDKQSGQQQERTEWHRVVFFNRLAEIAGEYLRKGSQVYIEGPLRTRKWQDQSGADRYTTEIIGNEMQMMGGSNSGGRGDNDVAPNGGTQPVNQSVPVQHQPEYAVPNQVPDQDMIQSSAGGSQNPGSGGN